jgi:iron complex transport system ATP-binding protein
MTELRANNLSLRIGNNILIDDVSLTLRPGDLTVILGANGSGKTSALRCALGLTSADKGTASLGEDDVRTLSSTQRARRLSYLPQLRPLAWPNTVEDVVALGRYSYGAAPGRLQGADANAVASALLACDLENFAQRRCDTLSGGELARVHCARAFAAEAPLLIADEPLAALDPRHQFRIMDLFSGFVARGGGALVVVHDISLAARYATRLLWMKDGRILADGSTSETLTAERILAVYGVNALVDKLSVTMEGAA